MMLKSPPNGATYNKTKIAPGALHDVLDRDVPDLLAAGWSDPAPAKKPRGPKKKKAEKAQETEQ